MRLVADVIVHLLISIRINHCIYIYFLVMFMKSNQLRRSTGNIEAFLGEFELLKASY